MRIVSLVIVCWAGAARAQHHHEVDTDEQSFDEQSFAAGVTMLAATFETLLYAGNYQGIMPSLRWANDRFGAGASASAYRLEENGATFYGFGDIVVHGQATIIGDEQVRGGVLASVSAPVGDDRRGMGMGHVMLMPAVFGIWTIDRVALAATAGYSRAIGSSSEHDHGMWPLVEPMNISEVTWSAGASVAVTPAVQAGARMSGGIPIGLAGDDRLIGALRVSWTTGRLQTAGELQAGIVGDPFIIRGVVSTALSF